MNSREHAVIARFGRYLLDSHRRELLADGVPVPIGSRAFDVLMALIEAGGHVVTKDELASRVWPGRFIEDNCLQFQISALRKALAADRDFIKTIPGRGYCFVADVSTRGGPDEVSVAPRGESALSMEFTTAMSDLIGQEATSTACSGLVAALRLAARAGADGIVRTSSGTETLRQVSPASAQGWLASAGQPPPPTGFAVPTAGSMRQLAEDGVATTHGVAADPAPKRVFLLLSIESAAVVPADLTSDRSPVTGTD